jgi:two-component sensor histidine kinase/CHASE3 domain sensor protein
MPIAGRRALISTTVLLAIGLLALLGIVGAALWLGERAQTYVFEVTETRDTRFAASELRNGLQAAESSQRGFLATGNEIYLAPYDTAKALALNYLGKLQSSLARYPERNAMFQHLAGLVTDKIGEMDRTIRLKQDLQDSAAMDLLKTNRGKALMDEANVFLSALIIAADERLTLEVNRQQANAGLLRTASIAGAALIVLVVAGGSFIGFRYAREVASARDEVKVLNTTLEDRVQQRTSDLKDARDRAEVLLTEVNHRVANSLTLLASLVKLQSNSLSDEASKKALAETQARILAISLIHKKLYTSGDVRFVALDEYLSGLVEHLETSMRAEGHSGRLKFDFEPLKMRTDRSVNLGVIAAEWITNAFKYAYPDRSGEIRIQLKTSDEGKAILTVEDDGVGRPDAKISAEGTGFGTRIVKAMASSVGGEVRYSDRNPGTSASLTFQL